MKKWIALIAVMTLALALVSAQAEETPFKALYDAEAFLETLDSVSPSAADYRRQAQPVDPLDAMMYGRKA